MGEFPDLDLPDVLAARTPLSTTVAAHLREAILSGKLEPDTELPSEKALSERLGVSRPTIREAVRMLQAQGLLTGGDSVSTRRPRVTTSGALPSAAASMEALLRLHRVPLDQLIQLRILLEGAAFVLASRAPDPEALADARASVARMADETIDPTALGDAILRVHRALVRAGGNLAYLLVFDALSETISHFLRRAIAAVDDAEAFRRKTHADHALIVALIESGEGEKAGAEFAARVRGFYGSLRLD
jgi:DNA-binding FadR family transcriptional regulator